MGFSTQGLDQVALAFSDIAAMPDSLLEEVLQAEAAIVKREQETQAWAMLQGPYNKGAVAGAVTVGTPKQTEDGKALYIRFTGTQHGTRIAEIAFINEYGKKNQPARPFIQTAIAKCEEEAVAAGEKVYSDWLTKNGL